MRRYLALPVLFLAVAATAACRDDDDNGTEVETEQSGESAVETAEPPLPEPEITGLTSDDDQPMTADEAIEETMDASRTLADEIRSEAEQAREEARETVAQMVDEIRSESEMASDELEAAADEAARTVDELAQQSREGASGALAEQTGGTASGGEQPEPEESLVELLSPETFESDRLIAEIEESAAFSEIQKMALVEAVRRDHDDREALVAVLNRIRDALGIDPLE